MRLNAKAVAAAALFAVLAQGVASAADYPTRPIRVLVPYGAGGPSDTGARLAAEPLSHELGQPVVIENQGGAGGLIATEAYTRDSKPDGYTILLGAIGPFAILPHAKHVSYDVQKDFVPLGLVYEAPLTLAISPKLGIKSLADFVAYCKAHPGKVTFGSAGVGAVTDLAIELFKHEAHVNVIHVPFRTSNQATPALMGGQIDAMFASTPSIAPQVRAGKVVGIAVAAAKRQASMPDVPTMAEGGLPDVVASSWFGFVVSSKVPEQIIKRLQGAMSAAQKDPAYLSILAKQGASYGEAGVEPYADLIKSDSKKWGTIIKEAGIKLE
jgi:tripartite-type tricarboxylate transporter receptor subunit TctC